MFKRIILCCFIFVLITGCVSNRTSTTDITRLAESSGKEIGRLDELNSGDEKIQQRIGEISDKLDNIQQRFSAQLDAAAASSGDIREIIQRVFNIAYGLCDEVEGIRAELEELQNTEPTSRNILSNDDTY